MNEIKMLGKVRGLNTDQREEIHKEEIQVALSGQAEELYAYSSAPDQEIIRQGRSYWIANAIGSPIAAVTSIPSTAIIIALYNNEPDGGRSYVIDYVWNFVVAVTAVTQFHAGIIGVLGQVREAIPTNAAPVIKTRCGTGKADSLARTIVSATALPATTGITANWFPLGQTFRSSVVTLPGLSQFVPVEGRIIVPPGRYFGLHVLASLTTFTNIMGIGWTEKTLQLG